MNKLKQWWFNLVGVAPKVGEVWWNDFAGFEAEIIRIQDGRVSYFANGCAVSSSIKEFTKQYERLTWENQYDYLD